MLGNENSTDATRGQGLRARVEARKQELELALEALGPDDRARVDIEHALTEVNGMLTGDLDHIPHVVAAGLSAWLERNKHVNERHSKSFRATGSANLGALCIRYVRRLIHGRGRTTTS